MKKLLIIILIFNSIFLVSQILNLENKPLIEEIMSQPDIYYFGYAEGTHRKETNQQALQQLMSHIYVIVKSELTSSSIEDAKGEVSENLEKVLNTYTYGRLPDVAELSYKTGPTFHILHYIKKSEYRKIFNRKKNEIEGFLREAEENLSINELGKAFRNFYRAAVGIEGLQDASLNYKNKTYTPEIIFGKIREIAEDIEFEVISNKYEYETRTVILDISYQKKPVNDLNIYYFDHHGFIPQKTNQNLMQITMIGKEYEQLKRLTIKIDIEENLYNSYAEETELLSQLFDFEDYEVIKEIQLPELQIPKSGKQIENKRVNVTFNEKLNCPVKQQIIDNTIKLFSFLENELIENKSIFADEKIKKRLENVIEYNHPKLLSYPQTVDINKTDFSWEVRQFGVSVSCEGFPSRNETAVIDFDENGKIYNFCYTINPALHELFKTEGTAAGDWDYRQIAIKFLENYKTSCTTKNVEDVETLYSEDALIIIGKVAQRTRKSEEFQSDFSEEEIIYFTKTKQEHIQSLRNVFANNRFVWLQFDTFNINSAPKEKVYGISMKQNYFSSTYKDEGYLFLLIDFRGERPLIHVRNWQPGEWDLSKVMKLENFRFY